jgi:hypothetical protein
MNICGRNPGDILLRAVSPTTFDFVGLIYKYIHHFI